MARDEDKLIGKFELLVLRNIIIIDNTVYLNTLQLEQIQLRMLQINIYVIYVTYTKRFIFEKRTFLPFI